MPSLPDKFPEPLRPYRFHGLRLRWHDGAKEAIADCPFCGGEKWYASADTGQWQCKVCGSEGNSLTFIRMVQDASSAKDADYKSLASERKLLFEETLMLWGVSRSFLTDDWIIPGYNAEGNIVQLYRYIAPLGKTKKVLLATPGLSHGLFGVGVRQPRRSDSYICEGPWDGMTLWETMRSIKHAVDVRGPSHGSGVGELEQTGAEASSLLASANVYAVPGCNVFQPNWCRLIAGTKVHLLYDNDHPRERPPAGSGKWFRPAYDGMCRAVQVMSRAEQRPSEVRYLAWGGTSGGHSDSLADGFDVRDALSRGGNAKTVLERGRELRSLLNMLEPIPQHWIPGGGGVGVGAGGDVATTTDGLGAGSGIGMACLECSDWTTLINSWRAALKWTPGLNRALAVMLSTITSTKMVDDQLWVKVLGPPSCGKSLLCEAISVNRDYVYPKDTLTGLTSGYQTDASGQQDFSMVRHLKDKTLVINDGDTLLRMPNVAQVLSQLRAFYGRNIRVQYGNRRSSNYEAINATVILCGTKTLRQLDHSELGQRFLDCVVVDDIDDDLEDEINFRKINQVIINRGCEANGSIATMHDPDTVRAMQLTGGYVGYLRTNAARLLSALSMDEDAARYCTRLAKMISYLRARPTFDPRGARGGGGGGGGGLGAGNRGNETYSREMSARLVSQLGRLALCVSIVLNRKAVDKPVLAIVRQVALDTAAGESLDLVKTLYKSGPLGTSAAGLSVIGGESEDYYRNWLRFLRRIKAVERFSHRIAVGVTVKPKYRLTEAMSRLVREVILEE